jgi:hypothetical protein
MGNEKRIKRLAEGRCDMRYAKWGEKQMASSRVECRVVLSRAHTMGNNGELFLSKIRLHSRVQGISVIGVMVKCIDSRRWSSCYGTGNSAFRDASKFAEDLLEITFAGLIIVDVISGMRSIGVFVAIRGSGILSSFTHIEGNIAHEKLCTGLVLSICSERKKNDECNLRRYFKCLRIISVSWLRNMDDTYQKSNQMHRQSSPRTTYRPCLSNSVLEKLLFTVSEIFRPTSYRLKAK